MSISKINFQVYADGDKRILVVENCKGEVLEAFNQILEAVCGLPESGTKAVPAVIPDRKLSEVPKIKNEAEERSFGLAHSVSSARTECDMSRYHFPDMVLMSGDYAGMTPFEAVSKDGIRAVPVLCECSKEIKPESVRKQMIECCKQLISADLSARPTDLSDTDSLVDFFSIYRQLLGGKCLKILHDTHGIDLDDALFRKDVKEMSTAYRAVLSDLRSRTKI